MKYGPGNGNLVQLNDRARNQIYSGVKVLVSKEIATDDPAPGLDKYLYVDLLVNGHKATVRFKDGKTVSWVVIYAEAVEMAKDIKASVQKSEFPSIETGGVKPWNAKDYDQNAFRLAVDEAVEKLLEDLDKNNLAGIELLSYARTFRIIAENPDIEKMMKVSRDWYFNLSKMLAVVSSYRTELEIAQQRNLTERMDRAQKNLADIRDKYENLLRHPVRLKESSKKNK